MKLEVREGLIIASTRKFTKHDGFWTVPHGDNPYLSYRVDFIGKKQCTCDIFKRIGPSWCRHIYALQYVLKQAGELTKAKHRSPTRKTYPRDWAKYNEARGESHRDFKLLLHALCQGLPEENDGDKGGRPKTPMPDIVYSAATKVRCQIASKRLKSLLEEEREQGRISQVPGASAILNFFDSSEATDILMGMIGECCLPFGKLETKFAIDSTHFGMPRRHMAISKKTGLPTDKLETFKAHISVGIETHIISAIKATLDHRDDDEGTKKTNPKTADGPQFRELVVQTARRFRILQLFADSAYNSFENHKVADQVGAKFTTLFGPRDKGLSGGAYQEAYFFQKLHPGQHFRDYSQRNAVEGTNSAIKRMITRRLFSKGDLAATNEVLCIALIHNLLCLVRAKYERDLKFDFWRRRVS